MDEQDKKYNSLRLGIFALLCAAAIIAAIVVFLRQGEIPVDDVAGSGGQDNPVAANGGPAADPGPSFDVVRISRGGTGVIAGRAAPGSNVEIFADEELIATATADTNGEWVVILEQPLKAGPAELSLSSRLGGVEALQSRDIVVLSIPEREDERFVDNQSDGVVAVLTPRDGQGASRVLQKPGSKAVGEIGDSLTVDTLDYDASGDALISGRALPRATVRIYLDNVFIGDASADDNGLWTLEPREEISEGEHTMRLDQVIGVGDVQLRIEQPFSRGEPIQATLAESKVLVLKGNNLWHIARELYGVGYHYTMIFQENADQIRDPNLIYPGQLFNLPGSNGKKNGQRR